MANKRKKKGLVRNTLSGAYNVGKWTYDNAVKSLGVKGSAGAFVGFAWLGIPGAVVGGFVGKYGPDFIRNRKEELARAAQYIQLDPSAAGETFAEVISRVSDEYHGAISPDDTRITRIGKQTHCAATGIALIASLAVRNYGLTLRNAGRYNELADLAEKLKEKTGRPFGTRDVYTIQDVAGRYNVSPLEALQLISSGAVRPTPPSPPSPPGATSPTARSTTATYTGPASPPPIPGASPADSYAPGITLAPEEN